MKNHRPRGLHWYGLPRMEDYPNNTQSIPVNRNIQNTLYDISIILKPKLEDSTRKKKNHRLMPKVHRSKTLVSSSNLLNKKKTIMTELGLSQEFTDGFNT